MQYPWTILLTRVFEQIPEQHVHSFLMVMNCPTPPIERDKDHNAEKYSSSTVLQVLDMGSSTDKFWTRTTERERPMVELTISYWTVRKQFDE